MRLLLAARNLLEGHKPKAVRLLLLNPYSIRIYYPCVHIRRARKFKREIMLLDVGYIFLLHPNLSTTTDPWTDR